MPLDASSVPRYKWRMVTHPLQEWFKLSGKTKLAFAEEVGISRQTIWRVIRGDRSLSLTMLARVSQATGIPISRLVRDQIEPPAVSLVPPLGGPTGAEVVEAFAPSLKTNQHI